MRRRDGKADPGRAAQNRAAKAGARGGTGTWGWSGKGSAPSLPGRRGVAALAAVAAFGLVPGAASAVDCAGFAGATLPGASGTVTGASVVPAGSFTAPTGVAYDIPAPFCRVQATLRPSPDSDIKVEVWLPEGAAWNGRFLGTGNGGYAGAISYGALANGVQLGFATANTDMGTAPATGLDGRPIIGRPEKWIDWGYRATHLMTVAGKEVLQGHYGRGAQYAYFSGCSTGGSQALHEAQQFPADYDGILAGAPANNRTHLHTDVLWNYDVTHRTPDSLIPPDKLQLMTRAVLGACAAQSGGLPSDPYLTDPRACRWDPAEIQCAEGANDTSQCLTPAQVEAARLVYDGPRNPRTGRLIYAGPERGSESGSTFDWARLQGITVPSDIPLFSGLFYWAFGPDWDWRTFDYDRDMALLDDLLAAILNANDPDLDRFRERGGKLIGYHGWADALVPPQDFVSYYERVAARDSGRGGPQLASALPAGGEPVSTIIQGPRYHGRRGGRRRDAKQRRPDGADARLLPPLPRAGGGALLRRAPAPTSSATCSPPPCRRTRRTTCCWRCGDGSRRAWPRGAWSPRSS
jgi:feruloyl esterase